VKKFELEAFVFKNEGVYNAEMIAWEESNRDYDKPTKTVPIKLVAETGELSNSRRIIKLTRGVEQTELCIVARDLKLVLEDAGFIFVEDVRSR